MNDLESLPSNEFTLDDSYTFKQLLLDAAKFWKISHGAVESKSVLFVNREGKEWDLTGKVLYLLRSKLTESMRGVILRYQIQQAKEDKNNKNKTPNNLQMYDFKRVSNVDAFPNFKGEMETPPSIQVTT